MLSFLTRCSLIVPVVCALIASAERYTINSVKNHLYIAGGHEGHDVKIIPEIRDARALKIHPPLDVSTFEPRTIFDERTNLYIGARHAEPGKHLVWVEREYKWEIKKDGGKYILYPHDRSFLFWFDHNPNDVTSGPIQLEYPVRATEHARYLWDIRRLRD